MAISTVLLVAIPTSHVELRRALRQHFELLEASHAAAARTQPGIAAALIGCSTATATAALSATRALRALNTTLPIIVVAESSSESLVVDAMRARASDYFAVPFRAGDLVSSLRERLAGDDDALRDPLIGTSAAVRGLCATVDHVARTDATILITGETGTGKELVARRLHAASARRTRPFVSINCAAIPDTLLESELFGYERGAFTGAASARAGALERARGGTVLLDEVGDMSPIAQAKVLRAIESREIVPLGGRSTVPIDVRIVAATNQDLERAVGDGRFRKDLYFRLNVVRLHLPPLRERQSDIPALLSYYARYFGNRAGVPAAAFTNDAIAALQQYGWPGNVRELKNLVESLFAFAVSSPIGVSNLPRDFAERLAPAGKGEDAERERLLAALLDARWNKSRAARQLQCSRMTLYRRMTRLRLASSDK
jgi:DNA-binding NtrC family response regulator